MKEIKYLHGLKVPINWICRDCGLRYGVGRPTIATCHNGICDICGETRKVTSGRKYKPYRIKEK